MSDAGTRSAAAQRLADDPMLIEALANVRAAAIRAWETTGLDKVQEREVAWLTVKIVNRIEAELQSIIDDGLVAASRIQRSVR